MATTVYAFVSGEGLRKEVPPSQLAELLQRSDVFLWVDMLDPGDDETDILNDVFRFHPLAIEDCILERQYPKVDEYPGYLFIVLHGTKILGTVGSDPAEFATKELNVFLGERYLVTFHEEQMRSIDNTRALIEKNPEQLGRGPAFLLHNVLDYLVDHYLPVMDSLDTRIDDLEEKMRTSPSEAVMSQVFEVRQKVARLRRLSLRQREVLGRLARREFTLLSTQVAVYYRDVHDHLVRISEQAESYRELLSSIMEISLAANANRLNSIMKALTLVNSLFLPLTFITGVYGMNFDNLPGKTVPFGFWVTLGAMGIIAGGMLFFFARKRWL